MTQPDELIDSYRAAQKLQNNAGPSELMRRRILAHAAQLANNKPSEDAAITPENTIDLIAKEAINTLAANDSQWIIRALASVAVFGIAGLLMLQFNKDAPDEFELTAKPPLAAEIQAQTPAVPAAPAAPAAPTVAIAAPAAAKPAPKLDSQLAKNAKKSDALSRNELEAAAPKSEAMSERAAEVAPPPTASDPAAAVASAPAAAPATALTTMADSAKLSRPAPIATRSAVKETTNANTKLFSAIQSKDAAALKLALDSGDDKNAKNFAGTSALSLCVQNEQPNLVRLLIATGADVNAVDAQGVSPLRHARNRGFTDIVNLLLNAGAK